ncbi:lytic murein transglycosylase [Mesorhizobium sp. B1-1-7]|nr:lytic murein transglycosylase [Mesorhizobium sp. B1-1-7]
MNTPLCPAGHLPRKGGDWLSIPLSPIFNAARRKRTSILPISPLAGEMSGRTEGVLSRRLTLA